MVELVVGMTMLARYRVATMIVAEKIQTYAAQIVRSHNVFSQLA